MPDQNRSRSDELAYAAAGMEPPPVVPLRKSDPAQVGPYLLLSVLGSGGMGRVYLGRDTTGGTGRAAVKVVRPEYADDPLFRRRFEREISALGRVQGAHTARLLGSGSDEGLVWVATEYIAGPTLAEAVDARGPLDAEGAWRLVADLGRAVEAVWRQGIVHRDLKPSNVILGADGARVIDFGVVQATDSTSITATGQNVGTPAFMSPEQVRGKEVTAASDVFSLACTLAYAVAGTPPFGQGSGVDVLHRVAFDPPQENVLEKVAAVDADLAAFVRACLDKDPELRPAPDVVFRTAIGQQLSGPAASPPRPSRGVSFARLPDAPHAPDPSPSPAPVEPSVTSAAPATPLTPSTPVTPGAPGATGASKRRKRLLVAAAVAAVLALTAGGVTAAMLAQDDDETTAADSGPQAAPSASVIGDPASTPGTSSSANSEASPTRIEVSKSPQKSQSTVPTPEAAVSDIRAAGCADQLASGARGACVKVLQTLLNGYGLQVTVDGNFGATTLAAVKVFQTAAGISASGEVDAQTKSLLYSRPRGPVRTGSLTVTQNVNGQEVPRCLDADTGSSGRTIQVWTCASTGNQTWALYPVPGQSAHYVLVNRDSHLCLTSDGSAQNGQGIRGADCAGRTSQKWKLGAAGPAGGTQLVSVPDGFCLDAEASGSGQDGQRIQGWACAGNGNQSWAWR
ncbi:protein kinase domain-containing protein [Streptomyces sp. NPDC001858]